MEEQYFQFGSFLRETGTADSLIRTLEEVFLLDLDQGTVWLSRKIADILKEQENFLPAVVSIDTFEGYLSEGSRNAFRQEIQRIAAGRSDRVSCHLAIQGHGGLLSSVLYLFRLQSDQRILGFLSVDYESTKEYEEHLKEIIQKLEHAQMINNLTLEGSSDYVYQLDIVNNICTFSPNALDKLPLESPTFPDAFNRVLSFIVPEDRHVFLDSFTPFLTGQSDLHVAEYRVMTKQGNIMWISCHGKGIHDAEGRPLMIAGTLMDVTEQKKQEEEIHRMLYYDMQTGLKNRRSFEQDMKERLARSEARGSLLYMNIRKFKLYNELFGHAFGNLVLKEFANILQLYFPNCLGIYCIGGDEFLVHLQEYERKDILNKMAPFQTCLKMTREIEEHTLYINAQVAIVLYPEHGQTGEALMKNANQCLYRMSREEKEEVSFFAAEKGSVLSWQFLLENELRKDVEHGYRHFRVVYQPIVKTGSAGSQWIGAEALLRYSNPDFPGLGQMEMIRTLEYSGLILPVSRWVIAKAIHECSRWNQTGHCAIVHVNIAAQQVSDARLPAYIEECCNQEGLPTSRLVVELTETSLLDNFDIATNFCETLMKMGIGVALDDFGTGYSSFNYLRNLPLSEIKVDREYTKLIQKNLYNQIIVSFLYKLSEALKLDLCVEGVETEEELGVVKKMGVSKIQGFFFERPLEADVFRREFPDRAKYF